MPVKSVLGWVGTQPTGCQLGADLGCLLQALNILLVITQKVLSSS